MNKDKWNALPADIQKTIEKVNEEWIEKTGRLWDEIDRAGMDFTLKLGDEIISLPNPSLSLDGGRGKSAESTLVRGLL